MIKEVIQKISNDFLNEAKNSPSLMSDMAAMERYMTETYSGRIIVEIIQNADDAGSQKIYIGQRGNLFFIANDGRPFSEEDILSISRSGSSTKTRGEKIGYRGIGFKSTSALSQDITIVSNNIGFTFSKSLSASVLRCRLKDVPTIRIPFLTDTEKYKDILQSLEEIGYTTFFFFESASIDSITEELEELSPKTLLFLSHVNQVKIDVKSIKKDVNVSRKATEWGAEISFENNSWGIWEGIIGFRIQDYVFVPDEENANYYSYLPTYDKTPFPVLINADFSTDPSRKQIILDNQTKQNLDSISLSITRLVKRCLLSPSSIFRNVLKILSSNLSFSTVSIYLKNSLKQVLLTDVTIPLPDKKIYHLSDFKYFEKDYETSVVNILRCNSNYVRSRSLTRQVYEQIEGVDSFISNFSNNLYGQQDIISILSEKDFINSVSDYVYSYLIGKIIILHEKNKYLSTDESTILIKNNSAVSPFKSVIGNSKDIKNILSLNENNSLIQEFAIEQFCKDNNIKYLKEEKHQSSLETDYNYSWVNKDSGKVTSNKIPIVEKWRSAEFACIEIERFLGNSAIDVSRQNLGYDIESTLPDGKRKYIEVKLIKPAEGSFSITNNEYTAAHQFKEDYYICLIIRSDINSKAIYIQNPLSNIHFEKRIRQWEWYCDEYSGVEIQIDY